VATVQADDADRRDFNSQGRMEMNKPSAPAPEPEVKEPDRMEIEAAAERAKKRSTGGRSSKASLLSGGFGGFKEADTLG